MESIEFLGGKYNRPEQITVGPTQAFRAQDSATGRSVFIHRVSTADAPAEQASLLKLLTTALVKSAEAKRLVLDFGEDRGYWYVVTESEPQCALLRDWLQRQVDSLAANFQSLGAPTAGPLSIPITEETMKPARAPVAPAPISNKPLAAAPETEPPLSRPPAESLPPASDQASMGDFTRIFSSPAGTPPTSLPSDEASKPGEFTSFFSQAKMEKDVPATPPVPEKKATGPISTQPEQSAAGEFTQFFSPASPPPATKSPAATPQPAGYPQRPPNSPQVQRPAPRVNVAPPTPPAPKPTTTGSGEFTKFFSAPISPTRDMPPRSENLLNDRIEIPQPLPPSQPAEGDFTRMFGTGAGAAPPAGPSPAVVVQPNPKSLIQEHVPLTTQPMQAVSPLPKLAPEEAPSEFTKIARGGYSIPKPPVQPPAPAATKGIPAAPKVPVPDLKSPAPVAAKSNKNLIIFLAILAVLAVLLIVGALILMKK